MPGPTHYTRPQTWAFGGEQGEQMLPLDFVDIGQNTNIFVTILTFCQYTITRLTFSSYGPFVLTGAFNPLVSQRAKFQQLKKLPPTKTYADAYDRKLGSG